MNDFLARTVPELPCVDSQQSTGARTSRSAMEAFLAKTRRPGEDSAGAVQSLLVDLELLATADGIASTSCRAAALRPDDVDPAVVRSTCLLLFRIGTYPEMVPASPAAASHVLAFVTAWQYPCSVVFERLPWRGVVSEAARQLAS